MAIKFTVTHPERIEKLALLPPERRAHEGTAAAGRPRAARSGGIPFILLLETLGQACLAQYCIGRVARLDCGIDWKMFSRDRRTPDIMIAFPVS
jgi:hypothetical protein